METAPLPSYGFGSCFAKLKLGVSNIVLFSPLFGEDSHFDEHIFQMGWFNHQPVIFLFVYIHVGLTRCTEMLVNMPCLKTCGYLARAWFFKLRTWLPRFAAVLEVEIFRGQGNPG